MGPAKVKRYRWTDRWIPIHRPEFLCNLGLKTDEVRTVLTKSKSYGQNIGTIRKVLSHQTHMPNIKALPLTLQNLRQVIFFC